MFIFAQRLKLKADFHSNMSVRRQTGVEPQPLPGNSNTAPERYRLPSFHGLHDLAGVGQASYELTNLEHRAW